MIMYIIVYEKTIQIGDNLSPCITYAFNFVFFVVVYVAIKVIYFSICNKIGWINFFQKYYIWKCYSLYTI